MTSRHVRRHAVEPRSTPMIPSRRGRPRPGCVTAVHLPTSGTDCGLDALIESGLRFPRATTTRCSRRSIAAGGRPEPGHKNGLGAALGDARVDGVVTNLVLLRASRTLPDFGPACLQPRDSGRFTGPTADRVLEPGALTTVQDWFGRAPRVLAGRRVRRAAPWTRYRSGGQPRPRTPRALPRWECTAAGHEPEVPHDLSPFALCWASSAASRDGHPCPGGTGPPSLPGRFSADRRYRRPGAGATQLPGRARGFDVPSYLGSRVNVQRLAISAGTGARPSPPATSLRALDGRVQPFPLRHRPGAGPRSCRLGDRVHRGTRTQPEFFTRADKSTSCTPPPKKRQKH